MDKELKKTLGKAVHATKLKMAEGGAFSTEDAITSFLAENAELWESARGELALLYLSRIMGGSLRRSVNKPQSAQLSFGFEEIPALIMFEGNWVSTGKATLTQLVSMRDTMKAKLEASTKRSEEQEHLFKKFNQLVRIVSVQAKSSPSITTDEALAAREKRKANRKKVAAKRGVASR